MTTMMGTKKIGNLRKIDRAIRDDMRSEMDCGGAPVRPAYLLRTDGDTDVYTLVRGRVVKTRRAGHVTLGMVVNDSDLPCKRHGEFDNHFYYAQ